jgi:tRNA (mo5U34)-methyltransferase
MSADPAAHADLRREVEGLAAWYHTIDLPGGVTTPGFFDLRGVVDRWPWPDVAGKRCLDVGTFDGFLAFELERRGAAEVVAVDLDDYLQLDWPADHRLTSTQDPKYLHMVAHAGAERGAGFRIAHRALGSRVERRTISVYDLVPHEVGTFDVVVCGSLLLHLRDPIRALEAIRSVCRGQFLSSELIHLWLSFVAWRVPVARLDGSGVMCQWWVPNGAGHLRMLWSAGFEVEQVSRPYVVAYNRNPEPPRTVARRFEHLVRRLVAGSSAPGVLHRAALTRPRL